jgi:hypothetical protein
MSCFHKSIAPLALSALEAWHSKPINGEISLIEFGRFGLLLIADATPTGLGGSSRGGALDFKIAEVPI